MNLDKLCELGICVDTAPKKSDASSERQCFRFVWVLRVGDNPNLHHPISERGVYNQRQPAVSIRGCI